MNDVPPLPEDVYLVFCSAIDQMSVQRIFNAVAIATQKQVKRCHILFQSTGGTVGDGICLYNFFRIAPIEVILYNMGSVQSIATVAYLGAKSRIVHSSGTFMLHRTTFGALPATNPVLQSASKGVGIDDERTEVILKERMDISDENWNDLRNHQFWLTAPDAVKSKLATSIGEFSPPKGAEIYNI